MKKNLSLLSRMPLCRTALLAGLAGLLGAGVTADAQTSVKANNQDALNLPSSWVDGLLPDLRATAVWDHTVTGANAVGLGDVASWNGIRILDPGGAVTISGSTLTLGPGGVDLSEATQDLTIQSAVDFSAPATIAVGPDASLQFDGELTRASTAGWDFRVDPAGEAILPTVWVDLLLSGEQIIATYNGIDFAAGEYSDAAVPRKVIPAQEDSFLVDEYYTPNPPGDPENPDALPELESGGEVYTFLMDFVDDSSGGVSTGGGNVGIYNSRFNMPNANFDGWTVNTSNDGHTMSIASILVTENVGAQDVTFGGPGWTRIHGTGSGLLVFQNNTQGDLILAPGATLSEQGGGRSLSKLGEGRLIIDAIAAYTGPTYVQNGTLQFTKTLGSTNLVEVADGATLDLAGASLTISEMNVHPGGLVTGYGRVSGGVNNEGDLLIVGEGRRLLLTGDVVNHGTILVQEGGHLKIDGTFANHGTLDYSGGYATLPDGYTNDGTVIEGINGPPPSLVDDARITSVTEQDGQIHLEIPGVAGYNYQLERSFTLRSPVLDLTRVTTADGEGADAFLSNDDQSQGPYWPDTNHGDGGGIDVRNFDGTRMKMGLVRFDISEIAEGHVLDETVFSIYTLASNRTRTFELWGVTDESLDNWIESGEGGVTYENFGGFLPAEIGYKEVNTEAMTLLGTFEVEAASGRTFSTDPETVPLGDFLRSSTDSLVTFVFFMTGTDGSASYAFAAKENASLGAPDPLTLEPMIPPTLTVPSEAYLAERELYDEWTAIGAAQSGNDDVLTFTDEVPAEEARAFYRITVEQ